MEAGVRGKKHFGFRGKYTDLLCCISNELPLKHVTSVSNFQVNMYDISYFQQMFNLIQVFASCMDDRNARRYLGGIVFELKRISVGIKLIHSKRRPICGTLTR